MEQQQQQKTNDVTRSLTIQTNENAFASTVKREKN